RSCACPARLAPERGSPALSAGRHRPADPISSSRGARPRGRAHVADDDWAPAAASALEEITGTGPRPSEGIEVPGYADLREVARGGDSIVYRARQLSLDRDVAIKVIQVADPEAAGRFERELAITLRLGRQHPHIVTVLDTTT